MSGKKNLTLGSLFSGSGGFELAGLLAGVRPVWNSEIEPFAIRVTTKRLPQMKLYGDESKLSGADFPPVEIITFWRALCTVTSWTADSSCGFSPHIRQYYLAI